MTISSEWESCWGETGNLPWRSGTVFWASLTLNWLSPARARHPRWHSPSLWAFTTFCWRWDATKGKSCHWKLPDFCITSNCPHLPCLCRRYLNPTVTFCGLTLSMPAPDSSNLARTKLQGLKDWQRKKRGDFSSRICNSHLGNGNAQWLLFQESYEAPCSGENLKHRLGLTSCILEWSLSFLVRFLLQLA